MIHVARGARRAELRRRTTRRRQVALVAAGGVRIARVDVQRSACAAHHLAELHVGGLGDLAPALALRAKREDAGEAGGRAGDYGGRRGTAGRERPAKEDRLPLFRRGATGDAGVAQRLGGHGESDVGFAVTEFHRGRERGGFSLDVERHGGAVVQAFDQQAGVGGCAGDVGELG